MFNTEEWEQALLFYGEIRKNDEAISQIENKAITYIRELIGYTAEDVGSFGLGLNLPDSDLDLAVGVSNNDLQRVILILKENLNFKGERRTTDRSSRYVFVTELEKVEIDVGVMPDEDMKILRKSLEACRKKMTQNEKIEHVWEKYKLKRDGMMQEYAALKLIPYRTFCPTFSWIPILDTK
jgi:Nucleotidyltransferase domain